MSGSEPGLQKLPLQHSLQADLGVHTVPCPLRTSFSSSVQELGAECMGQKLEEIKAYKLGKKRWSYNQVDVVLVERGGKRELYSKQALHKGQANEVLGDMGGVSYQVTLSNFEVIQIHAFLVYDDPTILEKQMGDRMYGWELVNREHCKRGCQGPILRALQRFGRLGKRTGSNCTTPRSPAPGSCVNSAASTPSGTIERSFSGMKDSRYMYMSFDEAVTHCGTYVEDLQGGKHKLSSSSRCFRLVCGAYAGTELISTAVSQRIRVLANNDVPGGAAHIEMRIEVDSSWPGWNSTFDPVALNFNRSFSGMGQFNPSQSNSLPSMNLPSPSTMDIGRKQSDESFATPRRLNARLRKTMSTGQKRISALLDSAEDNDGILRRTQSMKKVKPMINLTARSEGSHGLTSPFANIWGGGSAGVQQHCPRSPPGAGEEDPIQDFVRLMMETLDASPRDDIPIVEIPDQPPTLDVSMTDGRYLESFLGALQGGLDDMAPLDLFPPEDIPENR
jgi:hypothetical protein